MKQIKNLIHFDDETFIHLHEEPILSNRQLESYKELKVDDSVFKYIKETERKPNAKLQV